jgi:hypothetical protein
MKNFRDLNQILGQDELDKLIAETIYMADRPRTWKEYFGDLFGFDIKLFHPFNFLIYKRPKFDTNWHPSDDLYQYGFSLDLTTEIYYYTYDWGVGFNFRIFGWGFEIVKVGK